MRFVTDCPKCDATVAAFLPRFTSVWDLEGNGIYVEGSHIEQLRDYPAGDCEERVLFRIRLVPDTGKFDVRTYKLEEF